MAKPRPASISTVKVRVKTGAKANTLTPEGDLFRIEVRVAPQENKANLKVRELVADHFNLTTAAVRILKGHHSPSKLLQVVKPH